MASEDVDNIYRDFQRDLAAASDPSALEEIRRIHKGKTSPIKNLLKQIGGLPAEERPRFAAQLNELQSRIEAELQEAITAAEERALAQRLEAEWIDPTLPGRPLGHGARHPVTVVEERILSVLRQLGFELLDGPEVEDPYYNFDALNIPEHHPARDMQDTFWVTGHKLLRSHTTTVQARLLERRPQLPIRIASAGRVYRNEAVDATHLAMFHQLEGIWVDRGLTFAHLKGVLAFIAQSLYGDRPVRFKPKFYPYTEPSVGVDLGCGQCRGSGCDACHGAGWVTILGAGMIHPKVFTEFGFDPSEVSGIAFGLGTTRMAPQAVGVSKVKSLYEQDLRVHTALRREIR